MVNYHQAVYDLCGVDSFKFDEMIQHEVDCAGGLLHRDAAAHLAAIKLGLKFNTSVSKYGDNVWIYTFVASKETNNTLNGSKIDE